MQSISENCDLGCLRVQRAAYLPAGEGSRLKGRKGEPTHWDEEPAVLALFLSRARARPGQLLRRRGTDVGLS